MQNVVSQVKVEKDQRTTQVKAERQEMRDELPHINLVRVYPRVHLFTNREDACTQEAKRHNLKQNDCKLAYDGKVEDCVCLTTIDRRCVGQIIRDSF